jgi:hypothetical protein
MDPDHLITICLWQIISDNEACQRRRSSAPSLNQIAAHNYFGVITAAESLACPSCDNQRITLSGAQCGKARVLVCDKDLWLKAFRIRAKIS